MPRSIRVEQTGLTLDLLLWRAYGLPGNTDEMLTAALKLNPGLAARGVHIPILTVVTLPDLPTRRRAPARPVVDLFGS